MDAGLIGWGRAVAARQRPPGVPLWLFTDAARIADPLAVVRRLPRGLCGVVFRDDDRPGRAALAAAIAVACRDRRIPLVIAGDDRLACRLRAGLHLRDGRRGVRRLPRLVTSSAHDGASLRRAGRAGAAVIFLSPVFPTASHPGGAVLGALGWRRLARGLGGQRVGALGGIDGGSVRRLGCDCAAIGAIGALATGVCGSSATVFRKCRDHVSQSVAGGRSAQQ